MSNVDAFSCDYLYSWSLYFPCWLGFLIVHLRGATVELVISRKVAGKQHHSTAVGNCEDPVSAVGSLRKVKRSADWKKGSATRHQARSRGADCLPEPLASTSVLFRVPTRRATSSLSAVPLSSEAESGMANAATGPCIKDESWNNVKVHMNECISAVSVGLCVCVCVLVATDRKKTRCTYSFICSFCHSLSFSCISWG